MSNDVCFFIFPEFTMKDIIGVCYRSDVGRLVINDEIEIELDENYYCELDPWPHPDETSLTISAGAVSVHVNLQNLYYYSDNSKESMFFFETEAGWFGVEPPEDTTYRAQDVSLANRMVEFTEQKNSVELYREYEKRRREYNKLIVEREKIYNTLLAYQSKMDCIKKYNNILPAKCNDDSVSVTVFTPENTLNARKRFHEELNVMYTVSEMMSDKTYFEMFNYIKTFSAICGIPLDCDIKFTRDWSHQKMDKKAVAISQCLKLVQSLSIPCKHPKDLKALLTALHSYSPLSDSDASHDS